MSSLVSYGMAVTILIILLYYVKVISLSAENCKQTKRRVYIATMHNKSDTWIWKQGFSAECPNYPLHNLYSDYGNDI